MQRQVTVLYATASGNSEQLAEFTTERLRALGADVCLKNVADYPAEQLANATVVILLVSTWGEGAPPPDAEEFCAALHAGTSSLAHLHYAVLALGSSAYAEFCACGRRMDEDLARRGARRLWPRVDCDTKYKADFTQWLGNVVSAIGAHA